MKISCKEKGCAKVQDKAEAFVTKQQLLNYVYEVLVSEFKDNVVFRGIYFLSRILPESCARQPDCIDVMIFDIELYREVSAALSQVGELLRSIGNIPTYEIREAIDYSDCGYAHYYDTNNRLYISVNVFLSRGRHAIKDYVWNYYQCRALKIERLLARKVVLLCTGMKSNLAADLYDMKVVLENMNVDLALVHGCILKHYKTLEMLNNFPCTEQVIHRLKYDYTNQKLVSIDGTPIAVDDFDNVFRFVSTVVLNIYASDLNCKLMWNHETRCIERKCTC